MNKLSEELTIKEKAAITILFFIVKMLNPTGYQHEITNLQKAITGEE